MQKRLFHHFKWNRCFRNTAASGMSLLKRGAGHFGQLLYPLKCLKCGVYMDPGTGETHTMETCFCEHCMGAGLFPIDKPFCTMCGTKFFQGHDENHVCGTCLKHPLKLERVRAAVTYKGIIKDAIPLFKYQSKLHLAKVFEHLLFRTFLDHYAQEKIDVIMPVPLHRSKLRQRGFNQAYLLVRNFVSLYEAAFHRTPGWKIDALSLHRIKKTEPQTGFDIRERKKNLKNAFKVVIPLAVEKKNILLIDDVFTTGATCNEAAGELIKKNAGKVQSLVIART